MIENHYKTVRHQIECRKLRESEVVEMTLLKEDTDEYRKKLWKMNNFQQKEVIPRTWQSKETLIIPLESEEKLEDPRINTWKHPMDTQSKDEPDQKSRKTTSEKQHHSTRSTLKIGESPQEYPIIEKTLGEKCTKKLTSVTSLKSGFFAEDTIVEKTNFEKETRNSIKSESTAMESRINTSHTKLDTLQDPQEERRKTTQIQLDIAEPEILMEGIILHVTESDLQLFPDGENSKKLVNVEKNEEDCKETRTVTLANEWIVKDTIGHPALKA